MITKDMALKAISELIKDFISSDISVGLKFDYRGYTLKVYSRNIVFIPAMVNNAPIEMGIFSDAHFLSNIR